MVTFELAVFGWESFNSQVFNSRKAVSVNDIYYIPVCFCQSCCYRARSIPSNSALKIEEPSFTAPDLSGFFG